MKPKSKPNLFEKKEEKGDALEEPRGRSPFMSKSSSPKTSGNFAKSASPFSSGKEKDSNNKSNKAKFGWMSRSGKELSEEPEEKDEQRGSGNQ